LQDGFGNYCLQYVLELGQTETNGAIMEKLVGHFPELSQQKFSSNVVEKCLKLTGSQLGEMRERIVREIVGTPLLPRLLQVCYPTISDLQCAGLPAAHPPPPQA